MVRHLLRQGPVIAAIARALVAPGDGPALGETIEARIPARHPSLVRDYVRQVGGDPRSYREILPPHFFPQWLFPLQSRCLSGVDYPLKRALNGGGRFVVHRPLPTNQTLIARSTLQRVDDNGERAILYLNASTGPVDDPECFTAELQVFVPLKKREGPKRAPETIPWTAHPLSALRFTERDARRFVALTGDINPIHWLPLAARKAGFRNTILHGYATMAATYERLILSSFARNVSAIEAFEFRFTRPLVLPASPSIFVDRADGRYWVGDAKGGRPYMTGSYTRRLKTGG